MSHVHSNPQQPRRAAASTHPCPASRIGCLICAGPLFRGVVKWLRAEGIVFDQQKLHLSLADRLDGMNPTISGRVVGLTDIQVIRLAAIDITAHATDVHIVRDLPPLRFQVVAAHELGHVWLANQKVLSVPAWCSEGFCELLAYRFATLQDSLEARTEVARISSNPEPTYGGGFRRIKRCCDQIGFADLCEALKTNRLLPV